MAIQPLARSAPFDLPIDSGLRSRVYSFGMLANEQSNGTKMQIGELAKRAALTVDAIRFYEKRRLLPKPLRTTGRFRLYAADDVERLRFIRQMHGLGFSLREMRELIDLRAQKADVCRSMRGLLKQKLADIRVKLHEFRRLEAELSADLQKCNKELKHRERHAADACPVLQEIAAK